jgi:hypothetical protein
MLPIGAAVTKSPIKVTNNASNANKNTVEFFLLKDIVVKKKSKKVKGNNFVIFFFFYLPIYTKMIDLKINAIFFLAQL